MLGTPLTCSIILVNDKKHLHASFSNGADYLYQTDGDDFNLGKTSFQCGRRNDALKFWTLWKSVGTQGLKKIVEQQFYLANVALAYIRSNPDYTLYSFDDSISVCFNYKNVDPTALCTALYEHQITVVGFGSFKEDTFIRLVTINANNEEQDILNFFKVLEGFVEKTSNLLKTAVMSV
jgi:sulfinoalanine decarboxylase/sulfinoalanine decarboxylase/aspartate 1-decarboxylase